MFQQITNFIKYHNLFTIILGLVFIATAGAFANEGVRNTVIGEEIVTEIGVDNSQLLSADLDNFDINLKINNILEDEENYYVDYTFNTIAVRDNLWQPVVKAERFTVNKTGLGDRDLGIYLAEEFSEVVRGEIAYLKEAQKSEKERGRTQIVKTIDYTGLIDLTLDLKNKILPGYEPVVKPPVAEIVQEPIIQEPVCQPIDEVCDGVDNDCDGLIDEDLTRQCGTSDVGACQFGIQTCSSGVWGECVDVIEPVAEICDDGIDNDCDGKIDAEDEDCNTGGGSPPANDTTPPVITLLGEDTVNINVGDTYLDAGATASDDIDGDIIAKIVVVNPVDTNQEGTYTITYNVSDTAGNAATEVIRTVNVVAPPDVDGDGVVDSEDACPDVAGDFCRGCPQSECSGCQSLVCPDTGQPICQDNNSLCQAENAAGTCQEGTCTFTCNGGYQKDESGVCQLIE